MIKAGKICPWLAPFFYIATAVASSHLTEKQLEALAKHVGKTYWVAEKQDKAPLFFPALSSSAYPFHAAVKESFQITDMVSGPAQRLYYKAKFSSGKEGYISVNSFLEELNSSFLTQDPERTQKRLSASEAKEQSRREAWIRSQRWPNHIKEAVLKRQAVLGMNKREARVALGRPARVVKLKIANSLTGDQEQWIYEDGTVLTFTNGVISRMQSTEAKRE